MNLFRKHPYALIKKGGIIILLALFLSIAYVNINAQNSNESGLSISPVVFELNSDPGDTLTNQVKIYNPTENSLQVKMKIEDFTPVGEEGQVILQEPGENTTYSLAGWTTVSPSSFTIQPEQQQLVTFTIGVPQNGEPGGHYGSIVATLSGGANQTTGSTVGSELGALILLRVSGNVKEEIVVNTFSTASFKETGPIDFEIKFENTGNVHVKPAGFVSITDMLGQEVALFEIPQKNVIPGAVREANASWGETRLFGRYTATLIVNYGNEGKQTVTEVFSFIVFPWKTVLIVLALVAVIIAFLFYFRKRISKAFKVLVGKSE